MNENLIILPLLIPFVTAVLCLLFRKNSIGQHIISLSGSLAMLLIGILLLQRVEQHEVLIQQASAWASPFGITIAVDMLSALMIFISAFIGLLVNIYAIEEVNTRRKRFGYFSLFHFLLMGVNGAFLAGDVFNLYVWFEVMLIASFVLLVLGNTRRQLIGGVKYMLLNFISSSFLLTGVGMIYGLAGTLNMADVALYFQENSQDPMITVTAVFFMLPFAIKAAMFPLFFWLPASYPAPTISTTAIFSGLLTKVGVYAMLRFFTLIFVQDVGYTHYILLILSGLTMLSGVLAAVAQNSIRRILSFHIISQIGYMVLGLALFTPLAIAGSVFYIIHHIIVKTNLFLIDGVIEKIKGSSELDGIGGLYRKYPFFSILFMVAAFSLAGLPPLSGFWSKFILIKAGFEIEAYGIVAVAIITGLLTLYSMTKIWNAAFWQNDPVKNRPNEVGSERELFVRHWRMLLPVLLLALSTLFIGLNSEPLMKYSKIAAEQLMNPHVYIEKVLSRH